MNAPPVTPTAVSARRCARAFERISFFDRYCSSLVYPFVVWLLATQPRPRSRARRRRRRLRRPDAHPGPGHPAPAGGPRRARLRPDRHRQDGRLRAARSSIACRARRARPALAAPRALVLAPTRELAAADRRQLPRPTAATCACARAVIFGGVGQGPQVDALRRNADIIVATPGRLLDLMAQGHARFDARRGAGPRRGRPHARHGLHPAHPPHHRGAAATAPEPACSRPPCRRRSASSPTRSCVDPVEVAVAPGRQHGRERLARASCTSASDDKRALLREVLARPGDDARAGVHAHEARRQPRGRAAAIATASPPTPSTATSRRTPARRRWTRFKGGQRPRAGRHRHRGARHRRRRHHPRHQLRAPERAGELRSPHRPHGARRRQRASRCRSATARSAARCATSNV